MAVRRKSDTNYGLNQPLNIGAPRPIIAQRAPSASDFAELGTNWIDQSSDSVYVIVDIVNGAAVWTTSPASGVGNFTSVTITGAGTALDVQVGDASIGGDLAVTGNTTMSGNLSVTGDFALTGDFDIVDSGSISLTSTNDAAQAIYLHANGGTLETIDIHSDQGTAVNSVNIHSDVGGLTLAAGLASADAINIAASAGGVDVDGALQVNIASSQAAADAVRVVASNAAGGIDIDAGTGGVAMDSTGALSLQGAAASDFSVSGAGIDLTLASAAGRIVINGEEAAADAVRILSAAGGLDVDVALQMNLDSSQAAGTAIRINASDAAGGIDIDAGTGGITLDSTGAISFDGAAGSNFSVSGAGIDATISSTAGRVVLDGGEAAADAIDISATDVAGGVNIDSGTAGIALLATGGPVALTAGVGSDGTVTITSTGTGDIILDSDDTMLLDADGVLELNSSAGAISIGNDADAQAINIGTGASARTITVGNATAGTSVVIDSPTNTGITFATSLVRIMAGAGSPDTVVTAPIGSLFLRTDPAGATSRVYVNTDGATAWTNLTAAA